MGNLEFRVLGAVEVVRDGAPVGLGRGLLVDLLAALLVSANRTVSADYLVDTVWHARLPAHPQAALHTVMARLRRVVDEGFIETRPDGYRIRVDPDHLDMLRFDRLFAEADQTVTAEEAEKVLVQALGLWRGRPLRNANSPVLLNTVVPQLTERYLDACEQWAELCLGMGRHAAVRARLTGLAEEYPFRERLVGHLIVALYRSGRQADALAAYESLRRGLREDLGVDPGPALQDLHLKILRADPSLTAWPPVETGAREDDREPAVRGHDGPAAVIPRQLPPDLRDFCGRETETTALIKVATDGSAGPGETRIAAVSGAGGVGKTALAVHVAHHLAGAFDAGQLFADLDGVAGSSPQPDEVLASFLRALGVAGPAIPRSLADRITMYRSLVAGRRLLIVLDNAASESQVGPLLPAASSCAVIVTSRTRMTGLPGVRPVHLKTLDDARAVDLLARIIGRERATAEAHDAKALAGLCDGLPLALRIAGARLAAKPHWTVAKLAGRLADARRGLNELVYGDLSVRASFALSYQWLDPAAQAMLRRVSLLDAPDFPAWAGAALLDTDAGEAEDICERLVDAQLLDAGPGPTEIRYRLHDLVRAFARERVVADEAEAARTAGLARAFGGWLALAERAHRRVYGGDFTILHGTAPRWTGSGRAVRQAIDDDPVSWLDGERRAIAAAVRQSAELGLDELSWDLAWTAVTLHEIRTYIDDRLAAQQHALAAAERAGNRRGRAAMLAARSSTMLLLGRPDEAQEPAEESLRLFTEDGDTHGRAIALYRLGIFHLKIGKPETAIGLCQDCIRHAQLSGDSMLRALGFRELALACLACEDHQGASEYATRSMHILKEIGNPHARAEAMSMYVLGEVHLRRGERDAAEEMFHKILVTLQTTNDIVGQSHVLLALGETLAEAGRREEADRWLREALGRARQGRQRIVEARALFLIGTVNPAGNPAPVQRRFIAQSLEIFTELALPGWQQRASAALGNLGEQRDLTSARDLRDITRKPVAAGPRTRKAPLQRCPPRPRGLNVLGADLGGAGTDGTAQRREAD